MTQRRPNVIFILADDMGYGDFGLFNNGLTQTPALDLLTSEGMCFSQHYSASPVCAPARAGLLTGRYPHRTGVIDTYECLGLERLALHETTIADLFQQAGYATGLVGKWHCGTLGEAYHPNARGFQECACFRGGWQDYYQWRLDYGDGKYRNSDGTYLTDVLTDEAIEFVRRHKHEPFFLHLAYNAPHFALQAPDEDVNPFRETGQFTEGVSRVYGMIRRMDKGIKRLLHELNALGIQENTIVIFTSDNGPDFGGQGDMCLQRFNCGLNGSKTHVYEGGIRLPLIMRWPEKLKAGRTNDTFLQFIDWLPTLAAACSVDIPDTLSLDGCEQLARILQADATREPPLSFWQWNRFTPFVTCNVAMRDGAWKLVQPAIMEYMPPHDPQEVIQIDVDMKYHPEKFASMQLYHMCHVNENTSTRRKISCVKPTRNIANQTRTLTEVSI